MAGELLTILERHSDAPFFSVVTVVLNDYRGLMRTLSSIEAQTYRDFEWIVIDGGSTDGTVDFLRNSDQPKRWLSERDTGIYDAMNKGIRLCSGQYVVFMNAGDGFASDSTLRTVAEHLKESEAPADVLFGGTMLVLPQGTKVYRAPRPLQSYVWHGVPGNHQATYYRRTRLNETPYDTSYRICGDYYIVAKLYSQGLRATYMDAAVANFRVGGLSFRSPLRLLLEPIRIQREVLRLSLWTTSRSALKRLVSTVGLAILSSRLATPFRDGIEKRFKGGARD